MDRLPWAGLTIGAVYVTAFVFAHAGGKAIVTAVLPAEDPGSTEDDLEVGSCIGTLEWWIILVLGVAGRWEAVALVMGAKSIVRFEEPVAEYLLVGTLSSLLVAIALAVLVSVLL
jgi:hypothetical protein